ncbi:MAG: hypothetical protein AB4426_28565, partial [Xenococcaceae cyanobacterium]
MSVNQLNNITKLWQEIMSRQKRAKGVQKLLRQLQKQSRAMVKSQLKWLSRRLVRSRQESLFSRSRLVPLRVPALLFLKLFRKAIKGLINS